MAGYIFIIIILVLVLVIIGLVYYGIKKLQGKVREFSRMAWGTDTVKEGIDKMQYEYASTPKSVSGMTSLYLPKITRDFPDFNYDEMRTKSRNVLCSYLLAINSMNPSLLEDGSEELQNHLENKISVLKGAGKREHFKNLKVHRTEIAQYKKAEGRCTITFQSSIQYYHYITDDNGNVVSGSKDTYFQSKYDVDLIYVQDRTLVENEYDHALGLNCPNCGAPISSLGAKSCEYCGTPVIELNIHAWTFSDIRETNR